MNLEDLQNNWAIIVGFVAGIGAWGRTAATASNARDSAKKAHERVDGVNTDIASIKSSIASIEAHQSYARDNIKDIRDYLMEKKH